MNLKEYIKSKSTEKIYLPDPNFQTNLRKRVVNEVHILNLSKESKMNKSSIRKTSLFARVWRPAFLAISLASIFILGFYGTYMLIKPESRPEMSIAHAQEILRQTLEDLKNPNSILHQKTQQSLINLNGEKEIIEYELWEDQSSQRIRNIAKYPNYISYQVNDGSVFWNYNSDNNSLFKEYYVFEDPKDKESKLGTRVIDAFQFYEFLISQDEQQLSMTSEKIDGIEYYVIADRTGEDIEKTLQMKSETDMNKYYFDKEEFILRKQQYLVLTPESQTVVNETNITVLEALERNQNNLDNLFKFDFEIPEKVNISEKYITVKPGWYTEETEWTQIPSADTTEENSFENEKNKAIDREIERIKKLDTFKNNEFSIKIPSDWYLEDVLFDYSGNFEEDNVTGIVLSKYNYYIMIDSNVVITGGETGAPFEQLCDERKTYEEKILKNKYIRKDTYQTMYLNDEKEDCSLNSMNMSPDLESPFWVGSIIKSKGMDLPFISTAENTNGNTGNMDEWIYILYGYNYKMERYEYPLKNDKKLSDILSEMDSIVETFEITK